MRVTAVLSWLVIVLLSVGLPVLHALGTAEDKPVVSATQAADRRAGATLPTTLPGTDVLPAEAAPGISLELRFASRYAVGTKLLAGMTDPTLLTQLDRQARSDADRIAIAAVAGELQGGDAALTRLAEIPTADARAFETAYGDTNTFVPGSLARRYGFFSQLAEAYNRPVDAAPRLAMERMARQSVYVAGALVLVGVGLLLVGVVLLVVGIALAATGGLQFRTQRPVMPATYYVEAFALYLVLLLGGSFVMQSLPPALPLPIKLLPLVGIVLFTGAWPLLRGGGALRIVRTAAVDERLANRAGFEPQFGLPMPPLMAPDAVTEQLTAWQAYRRDVGLHGGTGVLKEIGWGVVGYIAGLPIIGLALLIVLILSQWTETTTTHPIVHSIDGSSAFSLLLLAAVFAPLTEELMFRGLFVSHLRRGMGVALAAIVSGLIFAAVHPQGWLAIPALSAIGAWLAVIRQWRGSLIPSIVIHAINNGVIVMILVTLLR